MLLLALLFVLAAFGLLVAALATSTMLWAWVSVVASVVATVLLVTDWWRRRRPSGEEGAAGGQASTAQPAVDLAVPSTGAVEELDPEVEPAEEDTDAADVLVVSDLSVEVRVLDERPRYHLAQCRWVGARQTLPLPVNEARQLGFSPCALCTPDAILAASERTRSTSET